MKTGKRQFNQYQYAFRWALQILKGDPKCTLKKAYAIDPLFGMLVENVLSELQKQMNSTKNFNYIMRIVHFYYLSNLRLQQEEAKVRALVEQVINLVDDYCKLTTADFLKKYDYKDWTINIADVEESIYNNVMAEIKDTGTKIETLYGHLTDAVIRVRKMMDTLINDGDDD